jgi:PD-(D/E)XK nuclease superfamily
VEEYYFVEGNGVVMEIDNSRAACFRRCPWEYYEQYLRNGIGVEPIPPPGEGYSPLMYGARIHERLEERYTGILKYPPHVNEILELESEIMMQAYQARYPDEPLDVVDVERTFKVQLPDLCPTCYSSEFVVNAQHPGVPEGLLCEACRTYFLPGRHILVGKMDLVVRNDGLLDIWDHKTEKRGSKSNVPQKWGARDQASLYLWAAERLYPGEPIGNFFVNVLTRQSDKGQVGPSFPAERQKLERTQRAIDIAIRDIIVVADDIERYQRIFKDGEWPSNRENCYTWGYCDYYQLHRYGEDPALILEHKFKPKEQYLQLGGIPIIQ